MRRIEPGVLGSAVAIGALVPLLAAIDPALYYSHVLSGRDKWSAWPLTPGLTLTTAIVVILYFAGQRPSSGDDNRQRTTFRHLAFFGGVAAIFLALQSPLEPISDHLFVAHQIEHMLLRTVGPMLLMLAMPQAALLRGLPAWARRYVVAPLLAARPIRLLAVFGHPEPAAVLFVATTYFWMVPHYHDLAILDEPVHDLWHATLLLSGLIFFWRVFDPRPYPLGASIATRLFMIWVAALGNILLGSYLSLFKDRVLYHAYDQIGRLWSISPIVDERFGGLTMWIPGSMMFAVAAMVMVYRKGSQEDRAAERYRRDRVATTASETLSRRRDGNRRTAVGLLGFALTVLAITFAVAVLYHREVGHP